jgi:hypothetical protein
MPFLRSGHSRGSDAALAAQQGELAPLTVVRVNAPSVRRDAGRRRVQLAYDRVFVPSLVLDHTELMLRQHGAAGEEGFGVWAGTLAAGDAFVSTLVVPGVATAGGYHGEVSPETAATVFEQLDTLDLVPIAQIHSHPREAFLSHIDAQRPFVGVQGFLSMIVPSFGFIDLADVTLWRVYEFERRGQWRELDQAERNRRLVIDPSILRIG